MAQRFCPHLGAPLEDESRGPAQDYPSFENRCYAVEWIQPAFDEMEREQLLLADQATYCLGSGHRLCPRFRLLAADDATDVAPAGDELALANEDAALPILADADMLLAAYEGRRPRLGLWVGVATFLAIFMLCGGSLAVYTGWQLVGSGLLPFGERLAQVSAPLEQNQVFLLVTPTPSAPVGPPTAPILAQQILSPLPSPQPTFAFPVAVTPTPTSAIAAQILNNTANDAETPSTTGPVVITTPTPPSPDNGADNSEAPSDPALATAVAGPVIITTPGGPAAPTRRPTPTFAVPTSTPGDPAIVVVTATPTPVVTYAPAVVEFRAAHQFLPPQGCTTLFWRVENVRAVFLDNEGVFGQGERRVCIQWASSTYELSVLLQDGTEQTQTVTVEVRIDTPTPLPSATPTPVLTPTPTWTPAAPSSVTPETPNWGVSLAADGGNLRTCAVGQVCEIAIQVQNTGPLADEIFVDLVKNLPWPLTICRGDGICGDTSISIGVAAGAQLPVFVRTDIPADAAGQSYQFEVNASSGNSNRSVRAAPISVTLTAQ
ncbi:MAG: hypothetical protein KDD84_07435 [Caldilineaceae bacterium]|nr:hypothetical protein [Caldilineaceae bacterium]